MTAHHARDNAVATLNQQVDFRLKRHDALKVLADPDRETLVHAMQTFAGVTTYTDAKRVVATEPCYQLLCAACGWTLDMICPECAKGCGCSTGCTGWRHRPGIGFEEEADDEEYDEGCPECGAGHFYDCTCDKAGTGLQDTDEEDDHGLDEDFGPEPDEPPDGYYDAPA